MSQSDDWDGDLKGVCSHCSSEFKINASSGLLRKHVIGSKTLKRPCPGSYTAPLNISGLINPTQIVPTTQTNNFKEINNPELQKLFDLFKNAHQQCTLRFIPRAARATCRNLLITLFKDVLQDATNELHWHNLLKFPFIVLGIIPRGGRKHNIAKIIQKRVLEYYTSSPLSEIEQKIKPKKRSSDAALAAAVTRKIESGNLKAAVRLISQDEGMAPLTAETLDALRNMHPDRIDKPALQAPVEQLSFEISTTELMLQIKSFPKGSSAGPDFLTPQHLQDLILGPEDCSEFIDTLCSFINLLLAGICPKPIAQLLCGGRLVALKKPNGKIRPIAIGCLYRRIAAKCANAKARSLLDNKFGSLQLGVGRKSGAEAAIHAARQVLSSLEKSQCLVKLDITNAFNSIKRTSILEAVFIQLPLLYNFCNLCYEQNTILWFNGDVVLSAEGVQQGDPLGCTLFALAIHPALEALNSKFKIGYVDDITIADSVNVVENDILNFELNISHLGLKLNYAKCEVVGDCLLSPIISNFIQVDIHSCELLGAPLLTGPGLDKALTKKLEELARIGRRISVISSHDALVILKNVLSLPRLNYLLRCSPCTGNVILIEFDKLLKQILSAAINVEINDIAWLQASLPVRVGGLGLRSTMDLAPSAFLASSHASRGLSIDLFPQTKFHKYYLEAFNAWHNLYDIMSHPIDPTKQSNWDAPCVKDKINMLLTEAVLPNDKARLLALQCPKSSSWLEAWPISSCGLRLSDEEVRISVGLRLGAPICAPHDCRLCGCPVDVKGTHGLSCRRSAGRHARHSMLNDIVLRSLAKVHIPAMREPKLNFEDSSRVDGCSLIPWQNGKSVAWDVTVVDTLAATHLPYTTIKAGTAASKAAILKREKYKNIPNSYEFVPLAFETLGPIDQESLAFLKNISLKLSKVTADPRELSFLFQRLSIAIQKGNAISIVGSLNGSLNDDNVFRI